MKFESKDKSLSIQDIYADSLITSVQFQRDVDLPKVIAGLLLLKTGTTLANFGTQGNNRALEHNNIDDTKCAHSLWPELWAYEIILLKFVYISCDNFKLSFPFVYKVQV